MYIVINHLHLSIPVNQVRPGLEQEGIPLLEGLLSFHGLYFVMNLAISNPGMFSTEQWLFVFHLCSH